MERVACWEVMGHLLPLHQPGDSAYVHNSHTAWLRHDQVSREQILHRDLQGDERAPEMATKAGAQAQPCGRSTGGVVSCCICAPVATLLDLL